MEKYYICSKDEMYSYDEIEIISEMICSDIDGLKDKLSLMQKSLAEVKGSKAIFFMPPNTYNIFSLFQSDYSVCKIELIDAQRMLSYVENADNHYSEHIKNHLSKKLRVLCLFLEETKSINAVAIQSDCFSYIE